MPLGESVICAHRAEASATAAVRGAGAANAVPGSSTPQVITVAAARRVRRWRRERQVIGMHNLGRGEVGVSPSEPGSRGRVMPRLPVARGLGT